MNDRFTRRLILGSSLSAAILPVVVAGLPQSALAQDPTPDQFLVDVSWLAYQLELATPNLLVMDLSDVRQYRSAHIPGAIHSYWLETVERNYEFYGTVLDQLDENGEIENQGKRIAWLRRHGIAADTHVVAYDRIDARRAARIVWFLRFLGHQRASLLDGGFNAWQQAGMATNSGTESSPTASGTSPVAPQAGFYLPTARLVDELASGRVVPVDVRNDAERHDTIDGQFATGEIPGSVHVPWDTAAFSLLRSETGFDAAAAAAELEARGITPDRRIVLYGRFGTDCNQMWIVFKECGFEAVEIYDRGWIEWSGTGQASESIS